MVSACIFLLQILIAQTETVCEWDALPVAAEDTKQKLEGCTTVLLDDLGLGDSGVSRLAQQVLLVECAGLRFSTTAPQLQLCRFIFLSL